MTRQIPAEAGTSKQVGTCDHDTSTHRHGGVSGAVVYLTDPAVTAAEILERRGPSYSAQLALDLLAPLRFLRAEVVA